MSCRQFYLVIQSSIRPRELRNGEIFCTNLHWFLRYLTLIATIFHRASSEDSAKRLARIQTRLDRVAKCLHSGPFTNVVTRLFNVLNFDSSVAVSREVRCILIMFISQAIPNSIHSLRQSITTSSCLSSQPSIAAFHTTISRAITVPG